MPETEITNAKELLLSVRWAKLEADRVEERLQTLYEQSQNITSTLKEISVRGGNSSVQKDEVLTAIADTCNRLINTRREIAQRIMDVENFIDEIPDSLCCTLLHLRYVECLRWEDIADRMGRRGQPYGKRHIYRIHGRALRLAQEVWEAKHVDS